ncbi:MAG: ribonuclease III domain-containing protein [Polyangiales bacterium]
MALDPTLRALCDAIGVSFNDPALLELAVTHRSAAFEARTKRRPRVEDNERLEFLGDSVLGLIVSEACGEVSPTLRRGAPHRVRAAVVNERNLAAVAAEIGLGAALRLGRGEDQTGGRAKPSLLCDAFEALRRRCTSTLAPTRRAMVEVSLSPSIAAATARSQTHLDEKTPCRSACRESGA